MKLLKLKYEVWEVVKWGVWEEVEGKVGYDVRREAWAGLRGVIVNKVQRGVRDNVR